MRPLFLLALMLLTSCGVKKSSFIMGKTTRSDLVEIKGEPLKEEVVPIEDGKIMVYEDDEKYQLKGDIVVNSFKNPKGDERLVLFWKHKFKNCRTSTRKLPQDIKAHTPPEIELSCPEEGQSVIYTEGSDSVSRVVEYEAK
jgi:hypothetical protein